MSSGEKAFCSVSLFAIMVIQSTIENEFESCVLVKVFYKVASTKRIFNEKIVAALREIACLL